MPDEYESAISLLAGVSTVRLLVEDFVKVILFQFSEFANVDVFVLWPLGRLFRHKR